MQDGWQVFTPLLDHGHKVDLLITDGALLSDSSEGNRVGRRARGNREQVEGKRSENRHLLPRVPDQSEEARSRRWASIPTDKELLFDGFSPRGLE